MLIRVRDTRTHRATERGREGENTTRPHSDALRSGQLRLLASCEERYINNAFDEIVLLTDAPILTCELHSQVAMKRRKYRWIGIYLLEERLRESRDESVTSYDLRVYPRGTYFLGI